jgi:hypothetical protein
VKTIAHAFIAAASIASVGASAQGDFEIQPPPGGSVKIGPNTMPNDTGTAGQVLTTDGAGGTSWSDLPSQEDRRTLVDADANEIGEIVGFYSTSEATVINEEGYLFTVNIGAGEILQLSVSGGVLTFFTSSDCTGQGYVSISDIGPGSVYAYAPFDSELLYYAAKEATPEAAETLTLRSRSIDSAGGLLCTDIDPSISNRLPMLPTQPNNPTTTGVSSKKFQLPLSIDLK